MNLLTDPEFHATFAAPMQRIALDAEPPVKFWSYFDAIPADDLLTKRVDRRPPIAQS